MLYSFEGKSCAPSVHSLAIFEFLVQNFDFDFDFDFDFEFEFDFDFDFDFFFSIFQQNYSFLKDLLPMLKIWIQANDTQSYETNYTS